MPERPGAAMPGASCQEGPGWPRTVSGRRWRPAWSETGPAGWSRRVPGQAGGQPEETPRGISAAGRFVGCFPVLQAAGQPAW